MDIISLPNNTLVAAFNDSPDKRTPLRLATSANGGVTWTRQALIEDDPVGSFHYPALLYDPKNVSAATCPEMWLKRTSELHCHATNAHAPCANKKRAYAVFLSLMIITARQRPLACDDESRRDMARDKSQHRLSRTGTFAVHYLYGACIACIQSFAACFSGAGQVCRGAS